MVAPRLGARALLCLQPGLLRDCLAAMEALNVCNAAAALWAAVLVTLRAELRSDLGAPPLPLHRKMLCDDLVSLQRTCCNTMSLHRRSRTALTPLRSGRL